MRYPLMLKQPFGRNHNVDLDDSLSIKRALNSLGYYRIPRHGLTPYPDEALFKGIKDFQRDSRLRVDGVMEPGGETAVALGQSISRLNPTSSKSSGSLLKSDAFGAGPSSSDEAGGPKGTQPRGVQTANALVLPALPGITNALGTIAGILGLTLPLKKDTLDESQCDRWLEMDLDRCNEIARGDREVYRRCEKSAMERYANCLAKRPMGPLDEGR